MRDDDIGARIGERLHALRTARDLSLRQLGKSAGVTTEMVSRTERSKSTPDIGTISKLCSALNVDLATFFSFGASPPAEEARQFDRLTRSLRGLSPAARRQALDGFETIILALRAEGGDPGSNRRKATSTRAK
jgi:transcriptional regulator with XRE-family HTH domain